MVLGLAFVHMKILMMMMTDGSIWWARSSVLVVDALSSTLSGGWTLCSACGVCCWWYTLLWLTGQQYGPEKRWPNTVSDLSQAFASVVDWWTVILWSQLVHPKCVRSLARHPEKGTVNPNGQGQGLHGVRVQ